MIDTINKAVEAVRDTALQQILDLNWSGINFDKEVFTADFMIGWLLLIRQASLNSPLTVLDTSETEEALAVKSIPPHRKQAQSQGGRFWYVLTRPITETEAAFLRDYLIMKGTELAASHTGLDVEIQSLVILSQNMQTLVPIALRVNAELGMWVERKGTDIKRPGLNIN